MAELEGVIGLALDLGHLLQLEGGFGGEAEVGSEAEVDEAAQIGAGAKLGGESVHLIQPWAEFVRQCMQLGKQVVRTGDERRDQLKGEQHVGEGAGHHDRLLFGVEELDRVVRRAASSDSGVQVIPTVRAPGTFAVRYARPSPLRRRCRSER